MLRKAFYGPLLKNYFKTIMLGMMSIGLMIVCFLCVLKEVTKSEWDGEGSHLGMEQLSYLITKPIQKGIDLGMDLSQMSGITQHFKEIMREYPHIAALTLLNKDRTALKHYRKSESTTNPMPTQSTLVPLFASSNTINDTPIGFLEMECLIISSSVIFLTLKQCIFLGVGVVCALFALYLQRFLREDFVLMIFIHHMIKGLQRGDLSTVLWTYKRTTLAFFMRSLNTVIICAHEFLQAVYTHLKTQKALEITADGGSDHPHPPISRTLYPDIHGVKEEKNAQDWEGELLKDIFSKYQFDAHLKRCTLDFGHFSYSPILWSVLIMEGVLMTFLYQKRMHDFITVGSMQIFWDIGGLLLTAFFSVCIGFKAKHYLKAAIQGWKQASQSFLWSILMASYCVIAFLSVEEAEPFCLFLTCFRFIILAVMNRLVCTDLFFLKKTHKAQPWFYASNILYLCIGMMGYLLMSSFLTSLWYVMGAMFIVCASVCKVFIEYRCNKNVEVMGDRAGGQHA